MNNYSLSIVVTFSSNCTFKIRICLLTGILVFLNMVKISIKRSVTLTPFNDIVNITFGSLAWLPTTYPGFIKALEQYSTIVAMVDNLYIFY